MKYCNSFTIEFTFNAHLNKEEVVIPHKSCINYITEAPNNEESISKCQNKIIDSIFSFCLTRTAGYGKMKNELLSNIVIPQNIRITLLGSVEVLNNDELIKDKNHYYIEF